jgi:hypothetical protein
VHGFFWGFLGRFGVTISPRDHRGGRGRSLQRARTLHRDRLPRRRSSGGARPAARVRAVAVAVHDRGRAGVRASPRRFGVWRIDCSPACHLSSSSRRSWRCRRGGPRPTPSAYFNLGWMMSAVAVPGRRGDLGRVAPTRLSARGSPPAAPFAGSVAAPPCSRRA